MPWQNLCLINKFSFSACEKVQCKNCGTQSGARRTCKAQGKPRKSSTVRAPTLQRTQSCIKREIALCCQNHRTFVHTHTLCATGRVSSILSRWPLTRILLTWRIWWAPNNASRWQMGFNSAFKGLKGWIISIYFQVSTARMSSFSASKLDYKLRYDGSQRNLNFSTYIQSGATITAGHDVWI